MYYSGIYLASLIFFITGRKSNNQKNYAIAILLMIIGAVGAGIRYDSIDYFSYEEYYQTISDFRDLTLAGYKVNWAGNVEVGYAIFVLLSKMIGLSYEAFIFIFACSSVAIKYKAFAKLSPVILASIMLYYSDSLYYKDLGQIRIGMAAGILLLSLYELSIGEYIKSFVLILIAASIQSFAILGLLYYLGRMVNTKKRCIIIAILSLVLLFSGGFAMTLSQLVSGLFGEWLEKVEIYRTQVSDPVGVLSGTNVQTLILTMLIIIYYDQLVAIQESNKLLIGIFLLFVCLMYSSVDMEIIWGRVRDLFLVGISIVLLPSFLLMKKHNALSKLIIVGYSIIWFVLLDNHRNIYKTILFG